MERKKRLTRVCPIYFYRNAAGVVPFKKWYEKLDASVRARIFQRLERVEYFSEWGSFNMVKGIETLIELKFHFGSGYRIYCRHFAGGMVVFLGGDKSTQRRDIKLAQEYYQDYISQLNISGGDI